MQKAQLTLLAYSVLIATTLTVCGYDNDYQVRDSYEQPSLSVQYMALACETILSINASFCHALLLKVYAKRLPTKIAANWLKITFTTCKSKPKDDKKQLKPCWDNMQIQ